MDGIARRLDMLLRFFGLSLTNEEEDRRHNEVLNRWLETHEGSVLYDDSLLCERNGKWKWFWALEAVAGATACTRG
jgi:hypothetical protein